ncbi:MAG: TetR/AcrR family transcriptional regulator [Acidimicrobiales bacterium]
MVLGKPSRDRRAERHEATKEEILDAAWEIARADGVAAVSLRDIATRVGMRPPSLYTYFDSKLAIYDAMFAQGAQQFADAEPWDQLTGDAHHDVALMFRTFVGFCAEDQARYQLMFQRTIPGFEPSPESFALSEQSLGRVVDQLARYGIADPAAIDLFTAIGTGLASQQLSNDPGGDRWLRLVDDAAAMFLHHVDPTDQPITTTGRAAP